MAHQLVVDVVKARLDANWTLCPVRWPNEMSAEPEDMGDTFLSGAFMSIQFPFATQTRISVSDAIYREEGGVRAVFSMLRGEGIDRGWLWAEQFGKLFRDQRFGAVRFGVHSS